MTLFDQRLDGRTNSESSSEDFFESLVTCILSADDVIRQLAGRVATRLFAEHRILDLLSGRGKLISESLKRDMWRRRYITTEL
jgi:hypothetical protein